VQATRELEFFGKDLYDTPGTSGSVSYIQDYSGVWA
jgi:hypothetical protein